jgi:hypothetical protein
MPHPERGRRAAAEKEASLKKHLSVGLPVLLIAAIAIAGTAAALASPVAHNAKTPKVGAVLQAQADISPVGDQVAFNTGIFASVRACAVRPVKIERGATVIDTVPTVSPYKSGSKWAAGGQGEFRPIAGFVTSGETLRAEVAKKKTRAAVCKAKSISFVVP